MNLQPVCIYSNRIEQLYEHFANLWCTNIGSDPFARRLVVVNSPAVRYWLCQRLVEDKRFGIAAGLEINYVESTLTSLALNNTEGHIKHCPQRESLSLALELLLYRKINQWKDMPASTQQLWMPLMRLLWGGETSPDTMMKGKLARRTHATAKQLATLYTDYGVYGRRLLQEWHEPLTTDWQALLWQDLFHNYPEWTFPKQLLDNTTISTPRRPTVLHTFAISSLPDVYWDFLERLAEKIPVYCYIMSPSHVFWSDSTNLGQQAYLQRKARRQNAPLAQQLALETLLTDTHPLLASWGKMGHATADRLAISDSHPQQAYSIPAAAMAYSSYTELFNDEVLIEPSCNPLTLLEALQTDLTLFRTPTTTLSLENAADRSIQLHASPTRWREVQVLYDTLASEVARARAEGCTLTTKDIVILAPDISVYEPYLNAIFGNSESIFPIHIILPEKLLKTSYYRAFFHLLSLPNSRWEANLLLQLLEYPPFCRKHQFTPAEITSIQRWTLRAAIHWGYDNSHRGHVLQQGGCQREPIDKSAGGTWSHGLKRLLEGLIMEQTGFENHVENSFNYQPCVGIDSSDAPLLGRWLACLENLKNDLDPIAHSATLTIDAWAEYVQYLCDTYLSIEESEEESSAYDILKHALYSLVTTSRGDANAVLPFNSFQQHLMATLSKEIRTATDLNFCPEAIVCSSIHIFRTVPMPIIAILGMQEGEFPRYKPHSPLNALKHSQGDDFQPSSADCDRYMFLETLLAARRTWILSCLGSWNDSTHNYSPSPLLHELIDYLNRAYTIAGQSASSHCCYEHPLAPYHADNCSEHSRSPCFSYTRYKWAMAFYGNHHQLKQHCFVQFTTAPKVENLPILSSQRMNVGQLQSLATAPLRDFFRTVLRAPIRSYSSSAKEPLSLSTRDATILRRRALQESWEPLITQAASCGQLPLAPLGNIYADKLQREILQLKQLLTQIGIETRHMTTLELSDHCAEPTLTETGTWLLPPLTLTLDDGSQIIIEGKVPYVTSHGLITFASHEWNKLIRCWPTFLIYCIAVDTYQLPYLPHLLPVSHNQKTTPQPFQPFFNEARSLLCHFISYYGYSRQNPSPLQPEWLPFILKGDSSGFNNLIQSNIDTPTFAFVDEYIEWLLRNGQTFDGNQLIEVWQPYAKQLYGSLAQAWGKKNCVNEGSNALL
jgi:exodeoxyribonuclease V gamma subunit